MAWRVDALGRNLRAEAGDYSFSGTFSATAAAKERIVRRLMKDIADHRNAIADEPDQTLHQINLDVYSPL